MAQGGYIGKQVRVGFSTAASPGTWKKLEQVLDATPAQLSSDTIPTTVHNNANLLKSNIPGLQNVSDTMIKMLRDADPATSPNQNLLLGLLAAQTPLLFRYEAHSSSDPSVQLWEAFEYTVRVKDIKPVYPIGGAAEMDVTFMFSPGPGGVLFFDAYPPAASVLGAG